MAACSGGGRWEPGSPSEYLRHWRQLSESIGEDRVALVLPFISAKIRNRMIQMGVPFIVPDAQIHLPLSMIILKERYGAYRPAGGKPLSPAAQILFLIQLQQGGLQDQSSKEISNRIGYSRASVSTACAELEQNNLCTTFRKGKEQRIEFTRLPRELWETALPLLRSPVRKIHFVMWKQPVREACLAGISALSKRSSLAEDRIPTFALQESGIREGLEQGLFHGCSDRHEADAQLEAWNYDPAVLSKSQTVDPLSLYLSLRKNPDERVQSELAAMMEDFPWR